MYAPNSKYKPGTTLRSAPIMLFKEISKKSIIRNYTIVNRTHFDPEKCSKRDITLINRKKFFHTKLSLKLSAFDKRCLDIFKRGKSFKKIEMDTVNLSPKALQEYLTALFKSSKDVKLLKFRSISTNLVPKLSEIFKYIFHMKNLETLVAPLSFTHDREAKIFSKFSQLKKLKSFDMTVSRFSSSKLEDLLRTLGGLRNLRRLAINITVKYTKAQGRHQVLAKSLSSLVNLRELIFNFQLISCAFENSYFTDLFVFLTSLRQLRSLEIFFEVNDPKNSFLILNFFRVISSLERLKRVCLNLSVNIDPSDSDKKMINSLFMTELKELRHLQISSTSSYDFFLIRTLVNMSKNLETLAVSGLRPKSNKEVLEFFSSFKSRPHLQALTLDFKSEIALQGIETLFSTLSKSRKLHSLNIWSAPTHLVISESSLSKISKSLKNLSSLKTLGLEAAIETTNSAIFKDLFKTLTNLSFLKNLELVVKSKEMTEFDINSIFPLLPKLERLVLNFTHGFLGSNQYFSFFKEIKRSPNIRYYSVKFAQTVFESTNKV